MRKLFYLRVLPACLGSRAEGSLASTPMLHWTFQKTVYKTYCMRHFVTQYYLSLTCSGSRPTPNPLPSRPLFVAGNLPPPPPSSSFSVRHTFCLALRRRRVSRVLIGRFALGKLWRQFPWSTPTHSGAAEVARMPRNAGARLRGRTTCVL